MGDATGIPDRAHRMIEAAAVVEEIGTIGTDFPLPANERQSIEPDIAEEAKRRQGARTDLVDTCPQSAPEVAKTRDEAAISLGQMSIAATPGKVATDVTTFEPDIAEEARKRQAHGQTAPGKNASGQMATSVEVAKSHDEVAKKVGLGSGRTYERAKQVIEAVKALYCGQPSG